MKIEFNYNDIQFVVDPAQHQIFIDGKLADGKFAPIGGIVVDVDVEDPEVCKVITDADNAALEKIIVYGAPLRIGDKVIILDQYVIPADIFVRNDLEADYGYWSDKLKQEAERYINACNIAAQAAKASENAAKDSETAAKNSEDNTAKMQGEVKEYIELKERDFQDYIENTVTGVNTMLDTINGEVI